MGTIDRPIRWQGTPEQAAVNYRSHWWQSYGEETECDRCLSKPWHAAASYPCGTEPPREVLTYG